MNCPVCHNRAHVVETRQADNKVIRRHFCKHCTLDFVTVENYLDGEAARLLLKEGRDNVVRSKHTVS